MTLPDCGYHTFGFIAPKTSSYLAFRVFDFGRTWWRLFWAYLMKVIPVTYLMKVILGVHDEGYSRNPSYVVNWISTFLSWFCCVWLLNFAFVKPKYLQLKTIYHGIVCPTDSLGWIRLYHYFASTRFIPSFGWSVLLIFLAFCVVLCFLVFCLSSFCVLCAQCCQFLCIVHSGLPLWFSLTFIRQSLTEIRFCIID